MSAQVRRLGRFALKMRGGGMREGALIQFVDGSWGEASPLPGWSPESLEDVLAILCEGKDVPSGVFSSLDAAIGMPFPGVQAHDKVAVNALLAGTSGEILTQARAWIVGRHMRATGQEPSLHRPDFVPSGKICLKVKARGIPEDELADMLHELAALGRVRLRIDPNRSWSLEQTLSLADRLGGLPVEYIEEPVAARGDLVAAIRRSPVPIALDETLREMHPSELAFFAGAAAVVLKPTLMGGFAPCREFALAAEALGMDAVVSGCFESGVGSHALGRFAASLPRAAAAGLDTYSFLEEDVLGQRLEFPGCEFDPNQPLPPIDESRIIF